MSGFDDQQMVGFTQMKEGTKADYDLLERMEEDICSRHRRNVCSAISRSWRIRFPAIRSLGSSIHLQTATRAERDGADIDWIVTALLHDIGDDLAPHNHDSIAAAVIKPYVREECTWVCQHHGIFQLVYYAHHYGRDPNARERFRGHSLLPSRGRFL